MIVGESWSSSGDFDFLRKVENICMTTIDTWCRKLRSRYRVDIQKCREEMEVLRCQADREAICRYGEVNARLSGLLAQEEAFLKRRAKVYWMCDSDTNSKFFYAMASARRRCNTTTSLTCNDGSVDDAQGDLGDVALYYFNDLFVVQNYFMQGWRG